MLKELKKAHDALSVLISDPEIKIDPKAEEQCIEALESLTKILGDRRVQSEEQKLVAYAKMAEEAMYKMVELVDHNGIFIKILSSSRGQKVYGTLTNLSPMAMTLFEVRQGVDQGWVTIEERKE